MQMTAYLTFSPLAALYSSLLTVVALIAYSSLLNYWKLPLPPGPRGLPIFGNFFNLPPPGAPEWQHWLKHKEAYGPISSVKALGQTIILIHDRDIAFELLDKRSAKYSSRPFMVFASQLCGYKDLLGLQVHNARFHKQRKLIARQLGSKNSIVRYQDKITLQVRKFLLRVMNNPEGLEHHIQAESGAVMLDILFGYTTTPDKRDPLVELIKSMMMQFNGVIVAGAWAVDFIPLLRHLPCWFPGTEFQRIAKGYKKTMEDTATIPFGFTEQQRARGSAKESYISDLLDREPSTEEREFIKYTATSLYAGGADTTVATLGYFFLAMTLFPDVQTAARKELDSVVGNGRLPTFSDRQSLPYVEAVLQEALRWMPNVPLSLPHATDQEDEYKGYRIPKGSIVLPSIGWFAQDPRCYHDPFLFKPERFLGSDAELDPSSFVFGFGRRVCPGRHLADANLWLTIACSLAAFDIGKAIDGKTGRQIEPELKQTPGIVAHPTPFKCAIKPRTKVHRDLVKMVEVDHPWKEGDAGLLHG